MKLKEKFQFSGFIIHLFEVHGDRLQMKKRILLCN